MVARLGEWTGRLLIGAALVGLSIGMAVGPLPALAQTRSATLTGVKVARVVASARATGQTGANASVVTYTVGATDATFEVTADLLVTTATSHSFQVNLTWTDEGNTAHTIRFQLQEGVAGTPTFTDTVVNTLGTIPYGAQLVTVRAKAATTITVATSGTFTTVTYNIEGAIKQLP